MTVAPDHNPTTPETNVSTLQSCDEYADWWRGNTDDDGELLPLDDPATATLAAHVQELQLRIDKLPDPDDHDKAHGSGCRCWASQCACAYDHPDAVCAVHEGAREAS